MRNNGFMFIKKMIMQEDVLTQDFKRILLKTFEDFIVLCKKHNFKYFAAYGTVLGAVRHHGFIPWDDDIDVYMPREDYERLLSVRDQIDNNYEIVDLEQQNYYQYFAKFVNRHTTLIETEEISFVCGIYIDIFPLDEWNDNFKNEDKITKIFTESYFTYFKSIRRHSFGALYSAIKERKWVITIKTLTNVLYYHFFRTKSLKTLRECLKIFKSIRGDYLCRYSPKEYNCKFRKDVFGQGKEMSFEHITILVPDDYDTYLHTEYGNYMEFPPVEKRNSGHHHYYVNLHERLSFDEVLKRKKNNPHLEIE